MISLVELIAINASVTKLLEETLAALRGEREFGPPQIRAISAPLTRMAPLMASAKELRSSHPELGAELEKYKMILRELQTALEHVRMMLLARRSGLETSRQKSQAMSQWAAAFQQTR